jgi:hypothetical protein
VRMMGASKCNLKEGLKVQDEDISEINQRNK